MSADRRPSSSVASHGAIRRERVRSCHAPSMRRMSASGLPRASAPFSSVAVLGVTAPLVSSIAHRRAASRRSSPAVVTSATHEPDHGDCRPERLRVGVDVAVRPHRRALVDLEIYDRQGRKVFQRYWDNRPSRRRDASVRRLVDRPADRLAGPTRSRSACSRRLDRLLHWNNQAATFSVTSGRRRRRTAHDDKHRDHDEPPRTTHDHDAPRPRRPRRRRRRVVSRRCRWVRRCRRVRSARRGCARRSRSAPRTRRPTPTVAAAPTPTRAPTGRAGTASTARSRARPIEIIQWAACKWGIDEDIVRAQVIKESYWYQSTNGDNGESWGLGQVRRAVSPVGVPVRRSTRARRRPTTWTTRTPRGGRASRVSTRG